MVHGKGKGRAQGLYIVWTTRAALIQRRRNQAWGLLISSPY